MRSSLNTVEEFGKSFFQAGQKDESAGGKTSPLEESWVNSKWFTPAIAASSRPTRAL